MAGRVHLFTQLKKELAQACDKYIEDTNVEDDSDNLQGERNDDTLERQHRNMAKTLLRDIARANSASHLRWLVNDVCDNRLKYPISRWLGINNSRLRKGLLDVISKREYSSVALLQWDNNYLRSTDDESMAEQERAEQDSIEAMALVNACYDFARQHPESAFTQEFARLQASLQAGLHASQVGADESYTSFDFSVM